MSKEEFDKVAQRMNEVGFTQEMAEADPQVFDQFLRGDAVMVVKDTPGEGHWHMVERAVIPDLVAIGAKLRREQS